MGCVLAALNHLAGEGRETEIRGQTQQCFHQRRREAVPSPALPPAPAEMEAGPTLPELTLTGKKNLPVSGRGSVRDWHGNAPFNQNLKSL